LGKKPIFSPFGREKTSIRYKYHAINGKPGATAQKPEQPEVNNEIHRQKWFSGSSRIEKQQRNLN